MQTEGTVPDGQTAAVFLTEGRGGFDESGMVGPELQIKTLLFCNLFFSSAKSNTGATAGGHGPGFEGQILQEWVPRDQRYARRGVVHGLQVLFQKGQLFFYKKMKLTQNRVHNFKLNLPGDSTKPKPRLSLQFRAGGVGNAGILLEARVWGEEVCGRGRFFFLFFRCVSALT